MSLWMKSTLFGSQQILVGVEVGGGSGEGLDGWAVLFSAFLELF